MDLGDLDPDLLLDTIILCSYVVDSLFDMDRLRELLLLRTPLLSVAAIIIVVIIVLLIAVAVTVAAVIAAILVTVLITILIAAFILVIGGLTCSDLLIVILGALTILIILSRTVIVPTPVIAIAATVIVVIISVTVTVILLLRCALGARVLCHCFLRCLKL